MGTRANVVVVVCIIILGGCLIVSLSARIRGDHNQLQCANNLRLIGLCLSNYADTYDGQFPPGTIPNAALPPERRLSWYVASWGFVGDGQVGLLIDTDKAWDDEENRRPRIRYGVDNQEEPLGNLLCWCCPANSNRKLDGTPGFTHYVGVAGLGPDAASRPLYDPVIGVFGHDRRTQLADIKNGLSNTLLVIETATNNGPWTAGGPPTVRSLDPARPPYLGPDGQFSSRHQVTNAAYADGSVRALTQSIDSRVLEAATTLAGRELFDGDW